MTSINLHSFIGKRIAATLIDYTLVWILTFMYISYVGTPNEEGGKTVSGLPALVPVAFWFFYIVITESFFDGTVGHQLMKLKVVNLDYTHPRFSQTLIRRLADIIDISWCFGLLAFIIVYRTDNSQRLGDILAKTIVVGRDMTFLNFDFEQDKQSSVPTHI